MRRMLLSLMSAALLLSVAPPARAADDNAKAIITAALKAHGGEELLTKYKAGQSKSKGKLTLPTIGEVAFTEDTSYMLPDKFKSVQELEIANNKVTVTVLANGDKVSIDAGGNDVPINDNIKQALSDARYVMKVARMTNLLKDKDIELSLVGEVKVEGKPAIGIRIASKGHKDVSLFFNKETHLLAKIEARTIDANSGKEITEERIILEYGKKDKEKLPLPKKILVKRDGEKFMEAEVIETKLLDKLDDSEFKK